MIEALKDYLITYYYKMEKPSIVLLGLGPGGEGGGDFKVIGILTQKNK